MSSRACRFTAAAVGSTKAAAPLALTVSMSTNASWPQTRQQLREAFPNDPNAPFLLHDRDTTFDAAFGRTVEAFGRTAVRTAPHSLWQHPYVERVIGSIRRDCLDHVIVFNERHLRFMMLRPAQSAQPQEPVRSSVAHQV